MQHNLSSTSSQSTILCTSVIDGSIKATLVSGTLQLCRYQKLIALISHGEINFLIAAEPERSLTNVASIDPSITQVQRIVLWDDVELRWCCISREPANEG